MSEILSHRICVVKVHSSGLASFFICSMGMIIVSATWVLGWIIKREYRKSLAGCLVHSKCPKTVDVIVFTVINIKVIIIVFPLSSPISGS